MPHISPSTPISVPLLILGGGVMGLWAGVFAERMGIEALVVEERTAGSGASGGLLGALMPHMPDRWNEKKQFQLEALVGLEAEMARLEAETGCRTGYSRTGRLIPLPGRHLRDIALRHQRDAEAHWRCSGRQFEWRVLDDPPEAGFVDASGLEGGFVLDSLAARLEPRALIAALRARLSQARHVRLLEECPVEALDPKLGRAALGGGPILFDRLILSAGHASFPMLDLLTPGLSQPLGQAVKGQAALLAAKLDPALPTLFLNGLYVVAHDSGHIAVGSTSENRFDAPFDTDDRLDALVDAAAALVPALRGAPTLERWAGLRPKAVGRDPMVGPHPDYPKLIALTGGFKVSFGLAHRLAEAAVCFAAGRTPPFSLPESFGLAQHISAATG